MTDSTRVEAHLVVTYRGTTITKGVVASDPENTIEVNANRVMASLSRQINGMVQVSEGAAK